jgi:hypothetical protein
VIEELIQTFFAEARAAFRALTSAPDATWSERVDRFGSIFVAACRFRTAEVEGEITYGDRELFINTIVGPAAGSRRYGLWEWADALGEPALVPRATDWVNEQVRLAEIVEQLATALAALAPRIATAKADTIARIEAARAKVRASWEAEMRESQHQSVVSRANDAFRAHRWARVVELLESVRDRLTEAEAAKLAYAKKRRDSA